LNLPRAFHTATSLDDGTVLLIGGLTPLDDHGGKATPTIERFFPASKKIQQLDSSLQFERWAHTATLLADGRVLVVGGFSENKEGSPLRSVEAIRFFRGGGEEIQPVANLIEPRAGHAATRLRSGMLLITGGLTGVKPSQTAEVFIY